MFLAAEIGLCIGNRKGFDIALEGLCGGRETADMGVDPSDQQLIASPRPHQRFEVGALERAVTVFDQHNVIRGGGQRGEDLLMLGDRPHARAP